jgi:CubicO group peptidase (beta-lactamase class C family)
LALGIAFSAQRIRSVTSYIAVWAIWSGLEQMLQTDDWIQFMLDLPMAEPPGTRFEHCNGASFLLSAIIHETTGINAAAFAEAQLFRPLGVSDVVWPDKAQGITIGWGALRMRPQDMSKIGYRYLNEGHWDGQQSIPEDWIADSARKQIAATLASGYGYQWWVSGDGLYLVWGFAGQYIIVAPQLDLVVVFTSNLKGDESTVPYSLLYDFVIPAAKEPIRL